MAVFDDPLVASIGPASFVLLNGLDLRLRFLPLGASEAGGAGRWGTVYYPISLLVLVNLCWRGVMPTWVGGIGALTMGWGDGLAAVVGDGVRGPGARIWGSRRTVAGSAAMFTASFAVALAFTLLFGPGRALLPAAVAASAVAAAATRTAALTPFGLDNLTVPLVTSALYAAVFL